jgi:hypothetical protein
VEYAVTGTHMGDCGREGTSTDPNRIFDPCCCSVMKPGDGSSSLSLCEMWGRSFVRR